jgi:hypothetical protein
MGPRLPRGRPPAAAVAAVLVALLVVACGGTSERAATTAAQPVVPTEDAAAPGAIWPATREARLEQLRDQANRGQRPDLLDPSRTARAFMMTGLPPEARAAAAAPGVSLGSFRPVSRNAGEVTVRGSRMAATTVSLRRYDGSGPQPSGQRPIWYVQGLGSADFAVLDADYDGSRLTGALVPGRVGQVVMRTSTLDGEVLDERATRVTAGRLVEISVAAQDQPGVIFTAVLTGDDGLTSVRVFRIGRPAP